MGCHITLLRLSHRSLNTTKKHCRQTLLYTEKSKKHEKQIDLLPLNSRLKVMVKQQYLFFSLDHLSTFLKAMKKITDHFYLYNCSF